MPPTLTPTKTPTPTPTSTSKTPTPGTPLPLSSYNLIEAQNKLLLGAIQSTSNKNTTNNQKYNYQTGDIIFLNVVNNYLFIFYYFVILIGCYYLFYDKNLGRYQKVFVLLIFGSYPYVAPLLKYYLSMIISYIYSFINVNAYQYN